MKHTLTLLIALLLASTGVGTAGKTPANAVTVYPDGRPSATLRLEATDQGVVLKHGDGPGQCDKLGARDIWVYADGGTYYMHYDGAGPKGWLACLAVSKDLKTWEKKGPVLDFGFMLHFQINLQTGLPVYRQLMDQIKYYAASGI